MVLNYPNKSQKYGQNQTHKSMSKNRYPKQDLRYLNLVIPISYRSESDTRFYHRLEWSDVIHNYKFNSETVFLVVRIDDEYPYKAILINALGVVLVSTTDRVRSIATPNNTYIQHRFQTTSSFFNRYYAPFNYIDDYDPSNDFIELFPAQDYEFLGLMGFTEYENDLATKNTMSDREEQSIVQEEPNYHSVLRRFEDVCKIYPILGDVYYARRINRDDYINEDGDEENMDPAPREREVMDYWDEDIDGDFNPDSDQIYDYGNIDTDDIPIVPGSDDEDERQEEEQYEYKRIYDIKLLHPEVYSGYPYNHYIHDDNYVDKPFATKNIATIIRADRNHDELVVMERIVNEDDTVTLRFITGDEIYFYYNSHDQYNINAMFDMQKLLYEIRDGIIQS